MRKFKKTAVAAIVAAAAVTAALSGCSKSDSTETTAAESGAESEGESESETETLSEDAKAIAAIKPEKPESLGTVKLGDISTLTITAPITEEVTEDSVNDMISYYLTMGGETKTVEGAAEEGDTVNIDYTGKLNGEEFDGGSAEGYNLTLGSNSFIDGFESGLVGHKAGDEVSLNLTFPEDYSSTDLAGKDVVFDVKINSVSRALTYEDLTDELANTYSGGQYKTADEYRAAIREYLEKSNSAYAKNELYTNAVEAAVEASDVEVTDAAIGWALDVSIQNMDKTIASYYGSYGISGLADYLTTMNQTYDEYRSSIEEDAEKLAKQTAVVDAIAGEAGFEYNDESFMEYLKDFGYEDQAEQVKNNNTEDVLAQTVVQYLVGKYITEHATVNYVPEEEYSTIAAQAAAADAEAVEADAETETTAAAESTEAESESAAN